MNQFKNILFACLVFAVLLSVTACSGPEGNNPGREYMPDMGHSVANEANVYTYYYLNTWDEESVKPLKELSMPRNPVAGTIPRGYAGSTTSSQQGFTAVPTNGSVPYYYGNTDDERVRAASEIIDNPFPITEAGLAKGEELYEIFCSTCHGEKGDGNGYLVREDGGVYPAAPANFLLDTFIVSTNGRFYHSIMQGKGVMGSYKDKISYEERWQVIHYIRSLQAKDRKLTYNENENTLTSNTADVPGASIVQMAHSHDNDVDHSHEGDGDNEGEHSHDGDSEHSHEGGDDHGDGH